MSSSRVSAQSTMSKKRRSTTTTTTIFDLLNEDAILEILTRLNPKERLTVARVCKSFRELTSRFIHNLVFTQLPFDDSAFRNVLHRYRSVRRIAFICGTTADTLPAIAESGLRIEGLQFCSEICLPDEVDVMVGLSGRFEEVKCLKIRWNVKDAELRVVDFVISVFPSVEKLDLSGRKGWSDVGIEKLVRECRNLRVVKLDLIDDLTDRSLKVLSDCVHLEHVSLNINCYKMSCQGFCSFFRKRRGNLKVLELWYNVFPVNYDYLNLANNVSSCENLRCLSIKEGRVGDDFLGVVATSRSPLTILEFSPSTSYENGGYTMNGVSALLHAFQGLTKLHMRLPQSQLDTQDTEMSQLVKLLPHLKDVLLKFGSSANATLFSLIQNCLLLEIINLRSPIGFGQDTPQLIRQNYSVRKIYLFPAPHTELATALTSMCPSLSFIG